MQYKDFFFAFPGKNAVSEPNESSSASHSAVSINTIALINDVDAMFFVVTEPEDVILSMIEYSIVRVFPDET